MDLINRLNKNYKFEMYNKLLVMVVEVNKTK